MRTSIIDQLIKGIFFILTILMLTACTGKNDIVLESGKEEREAEEMPAAEGEAGTEKMPETEETPKKDDTGGAAGQESGPEAAASNEAWNAGKEETVLPDIYVHICGAVREPGVYVLAAGSRVYEGIEAAGGFAEDACEDFINQAGMLTDGQRLVIPTAEEAETAKADGSYREVWQTGIQGSAEGTAKAADGASSAGNPGGLVNINTASEEELGGIPGIGAGKAAAIVKYRQENGAFAAIEEIMKVSGIKEGTFEKIKDRITDRKSVV